MESRTAVADEPSLGERLRGSAAWQVLRGARPEQWTKNLLVLFALFFSVGGPWQPDEPDSWLPLLWRALAGFALFCVVSSALYLFNDALDRERDRLHPVKRNRPVASGRLAVATALRAAVVGLVVALPLGYLLEVRFGAVLSGYAGLVVLYSLWLKRLPVVDLLVVAAGFVLRAVAGALVIQVVVSPWLYAVTGAGALFLGVSKRRAELAATGGNGDGHRRTLDWYALRNLDRAMLALVGALAALFIAYALTSEAAPDNGIMLVGVPFVVAGLWRYVLLARRSPLSNPDELLNDRVLQGIVLVWLAVSFGCLVAFR